jgi:hypothetical protein
MMTAFILLEGTMARRTVNLPDAVEHVVRRSAKEGESFSAAVARLIEAGARALHGRARPTWVGSGEGPTDLGRMAEKYLRQPVSARD